MVANVIWKYKLDLTDNQRVAMPTGATILSVGLDPDGCLCLWAAVNRNEPVIHRAEIIIIGTGMPMQQVGDFLGTVTMHPFVWHVFTGFHDRANQTGQSLRYQTEGNT